MKKKTNKKNGKTKKSKVGFRIMAVLTGILIAVVGILCTSPSKAADDLPYYPPETDPDIITETETEPAETEQITDQDTLAPIDTENETYTDTEPDTDPGTDEITTGAVTTEPVTTAAVTTAAETFGDSDPGGKSGAEDKQKYREYNGRTYADNETFVGEYKTDRVSVGVSRVVDGNKSYFICDIKVKSVSDIHTALANNSLTGRAYTSKIAASVGAGFAINGDFCGYRTQGIIIREGKLYKDKKSGGWDLCYLNKYGDLITCSNDKQSGKSLVNDGVRQSWCFGPTLVENYKAIETKDFNTPGLSSKEWAREPRTAIGQIDELHYIFLVVDAVRVKNGVTYTTLEGSGMNFRELADTFEALGCKTAYNLDGGGSTTLWLNGKVANEPTMGGERAITDIIYLK